MRHLLRSWLCASLGLGGAWGCLPAAPALPGDPPADPTTGTTPRTYSTLRLVAGRPGGPGNIDGIGTAARLDGPSGLALDGTGNLYLAMQDNATLRKMVLATGEVSTVAGIPWRHTGQDGTGTGATLHQPGGVRWDGRDSLYIVDGGGHTVRRLLTASRQVLTAFGQHSVPGSLDAQGTAARFYYPGDVLIDSLYNTYISDSANHTLRHADPSGLVSTLAGVAGQPGSADGVGAAARFSAPAGLAQDALGNLYIADSANQLIRRLDPQTGQVTTLAGGTGSVGLVDGMGRAARFAGPGGLAYDGQGALYIADSGNSAIRRLDLASGMVSTLAGGRYGWADGVGGEAQFTFPRFLAHDRRDGSLYVSDWNNSTIRRIVIATRQVSTVAGAPATWGVSDGSGSEAQFGSPHSVVVDRAGTAYVSDLADCTIRKVVLATGQVSTWVGRSGQRGSVDGIGSSARFSGPAGLALDDHGNLWVADQSDHTIRRVELASARVVTVAGTSGMPAHVDGVGRLAQFNYPTHLAMDGDRNLYVSENRGASIRRVAVASGEVTTFVGEPRSEGHIDGIGRAARFGHPVGLAYDRRGLLYVADEGSGTLRQVVLATREVSLLAGQPYGRDSIDGVGAAASFTVLGGLALDGQGRSLYVTDGRHGLVRRVSLPDGTVTTPIGTIGLHGVKLGPLPGSLVSPGSLSVAPDGSLIIIDQQERVVLQAR